MKEPLYQVIDRSLKAKRVSISIIDVNKLMGYLTEECLDLFRETLAMMLYCFFFHIIMIIIFFNLIYTIIQHI